MQEEDWDVTGHRHLVIIPCASLCQRAATGNAVIVCLAFQSGSSSGISIMRPLSQALRTPEPVMDVLERSQQGSGVAATKLGVAP